MPKKSEFLAFKNESDCIRIGDELTIENRIDRVSLYGSVDITLDREGLAKATCLKELIDGILHEMGARNLPDRIALEPAETVENPFV